MPGNAPEARGNAAVEGGGLVAVFCSELSHVYRYYSEAIAWTRGLCHYLSSRRSLLPAKGDLSKNLVDNGYEGSWKAEVFGPVGFVAVGARIKSENDQGNTRDDTAGNGLELQIQNPKSGDLDSISIYPGKSLGKEGSNARLNRSQTHHHQANGVAGKTGFVAGSMSIFVASNYKLSRIRSLITLQVRIIPFSCPVPPCREKHVF